MNAILTVGELAAERRALEALLTDREARRAARIAEKARARETVAQRIAVPPGIPPAST